MREHIKPRVYSDISVNMQVPFEVHHMNHNHARYRNSRGGIYSDILNPWQCSSDSLDHRWPHTPCIIWITGSFNYLKRIPPYTKVYPSVRRTHAQWRILTNILFNHPDVVKQNAEVSSQDPQTHETGSTKTKILIEYFDNSESDHRSIPSFTNIWSRISLKQDTCRISRWILRVNTLPSTHSRTYDRGSVRTKIVYEYFDQF